MPFLAGDCDCGTTWFVPVTRTAVAMMITHWRQGHRVGSRGRMARMQIEQYARGMAEEIAKKRARERGAVYDPLDDEDDGQFADGDTG